MTAGMRITTVAVILIVSGYAPTAALAAKGHEQRMTGFDAGAALEISQAAIGRQIGDHRLVGANGKRIELDGLLGKPLVVSFIYTSCDHTCPILTETVARAADIAWEALGQDSFSVLTVGFDTPTDNPERMRIFARQHGIDAPHWTFATSDGKTIEALAARLGFIYHESAGGFDHIAQTSIVDEDGLVYRQIYGETFDAPALVEPLKQLVFGRRADATTLTGWINGVKLFCTIYDPNAERYRFDYSLIVAFVVGLLCLGGVGVFLTRAWIESNRAGRKGDAA